jgi:hypothetical protein
MHVWPRLPAFVLAASAVLALAASALPAAKDGPDEDGPRLPAAIPAGAVIPEPLVVVPVRPDVYAGRATALARIVQCPKCDGKGTRVTRVREVTGHLQKPKIRETKEECDSCKGLGFSLDPARVAPVLDSFVSLLGALPPDSPTSPKQLEKARQALLRLGGSGELAVRITEQDRNEVTAERVSKKGTAIAVTGEVGRPIPVAGGRLIPVQVGATSALFLRAPVINAAPASGKVLVGGVVAGSVDQVQWEWGKTLVLDHGFVVPLTEPEYKGPADDDEDAPSSPSQPAGRGSAAGGTGTGGTRGK